MVAILPEHAARSMPAPIAPTRDDHNFSQLYYANHSDLADHTHYAHHVYHSRYFHDTHRAYDARSTS